MQKFLIFKCGIQHFGISTNVVEEIDANVNINPVPLTFNFVAGIDNFRGNVVALIDINALVFNQPRADVYSGRIVLKEERKNEFTKAILIERVIKIVELEEEDIKGNSTGFLFGFAEIEGIKALILDDFELLNI